MVSSTVLQGMASINISFDSASANTPEGRANIILDVHQRDVKNYTRQGHDLIIELADGRALVINGFFARGIDYHHLVFNTSEGRWLTYFDKAMGGQDGIVDPLVAYEKIEDDSTLALLGILGAAAAGGVAIAAAGSSKKGSSDTTPPAKPSFVAIDDVAPIMGPIANNGYTNDPTPTFQGKTEPGAIVTIYDNGKEIGKVIADEHGNWSFTPEKPLEDGVHRFEVKAVDAAGNVSEASDPLDVVIDTQAPAVPTFEVHDDVPVYVGPIDSGDITNDARPEFKGSGAEPGTTINIYDGDDLIGTAEVDEDGSWSFTPDSDLADGPHTITISNVDQAGNESDRSAGFEFEVDTQAPAVPSFEVHDDVPFYVGPIDSGDITNDARPEFKGSGAEPGTTINLYDGDDLIGTAEVDEDGSWSFTPDTDLADGPHTITISNVDQAGNESDRSAGFEFEVDTQAPSQLVTITTVIDDAEPVTGAVLHDGVTNDVTPRLEGTLSAALAAGEKLVVLRNGAEIGEATVSGTDWFFEDPGPLADDGYTYRAYVVNAAGNHSTASNDYVIHVDTQAPAVPEFEVHDDVPFYVGPIDSGDITNDARPEFKGSGAEPGTTINIYDGDDLIGTAEVDEDGSWSFTPDTDLADGPHTITISNVDQAGNESDRSAGFEFEVDTTAPTQTVTITTVIDDVEPETGAVLHDGVTDDTTPLLEGTLSAELEAGEKVVVLRNGVEIGEASVSGTGWSFEDPGPLYHGTYTYTAYVANVAGNHSAASADYTIHVDTAGTISVDALSTGDTTPLVTGSYSKDLAPGNMIQVAVDGVVYTQGDGHLTVDTASRTWNLQISAANQMNWNERTDATYEVEARIIDSVGDTLRIDTTSNELTIFRDLTIVRPDLGSSTRQPLLIGDGTAGASDRLIVEILSNGTVVHTFDSQYGAGQDGVIVTPDGWKLSEANWGTFELDPMTIYEAVAKVIPADNSSGGQISEVVTITTKNVPVTPDVPNDPERSDINSKIIGLDGGGYILMWAKNFADSSASLASNYDIVAQEYDASGVRVGELREITPKGSPVSEGYGDRANMYNNSGSLNALVDPDGSMTVAYTAEYGVSGYIASYDRNLDLISKTKLQGAENYFGFNIVETSNGKVAVYSSGVDQNFNIYVSGSEQAVPFATSQNLTNETNGANGYLFLSASYVEARPTGVSAIGPSGNSESLSAISLGGSKYLIQYADYDTPGTPTPLKMRLMVMDYSDTDPVLPGVQPSTTPVHVMDASTTEGKNGWQLGAKSFELKEGGFVSLWVSNHSVATSPTDAGTMNGFGVYARRFQFNHATNQLEAIDATENRVNTDTTGVNGLGFTTLSTGMFSGVGLEQGGYVVTWARFTSFGRSEIYAQRFDAAGNKLGGETLVSTDAVDGPGGVNSLPYVAALNDGGYAITWTNQVTNFYFNDNSQSGEIMTVVFNADGTLRAQGENPDPSASYISNAGVQTGTDGVNMLDGRHDATEMRAGKGDDYIIVKDTSFSLVDGGEGFDYLIWDSPDDLNFSDIADRVQNIEAIHLGDRNANTLTLSLDDVLNISSTTDTLVIQGGADDIVDIDLDTWRNVGEQIFNGANYGVWVSPENDQASLWVQAGIAVI